MNKPKMKERGRKKERERRGVGDFLNQRKRTRSLNRDPWLSNVWDFFSLRVPATQKSLIWTRRDYGGAG